MRPATSSARRRFPCSLVMLFLSLLCLPLLAAGGCDRTDPLIVRLPDPALGTLEPTDHLILRPYAARGTADRGNATGVHGCGTNGDYHHYEEPPAGTTQLHIVGVVGPDISLTSTGNQIRVNVTRPGASVLVLSAYDAVRWNVTTAPGVTLERILVTGYETPVIAAPDSVPVELVNLPVAAYEWPSIRATELVEAVQELTGLALTSFRGCYGSASFQIDEPGPLAPPHPVSTATEPVLPAGCDALAGADMVCLLLGYGQMHAVELDSQKHCTTEARVIEAQPFGSLGWQGDYVYTCIPERGLARISLSTGALDIAPLHCQAATTFGSEILAVVFKDTQNEQFHETFLARFASFDDVVQRNPSAVYFIFDQYESLGASTTEVYFSSFITNEVRAVRLENGSAFRRIPLQDYDDWIFGLDVMPDSRLALVTPERNGGLWLFDSGTGENLGVPALPAFTQGDFQGIDCKYLTAQ